MRTVYSACGILAVFAGLAMAENYTGKLLDASCYEQHKTAKSCDATSSTDQFLLDVSGKVYKLDAAGNAKAADAIKNRADRSTEPSTKSAGAVNAKVSGEREGADTIKVDSIDIQ